MSNIYNLILTDLKKISIQENSWNRFFLFKKFFLSRSVRIIILVRMLKYNYIIAFICSRILRKKNIEVSSTAEIGEGVFFLILGVS